VRFSRDQDQDTSSQSHFLILDTSIFYSSGFGSCTLKNPENPPVILMMSVGAQTSDPQGHKPEISREAFKYGLDAFNDDGCNDLQDGKWSFEYQPYENADLGCIAH